jgi:phosphoglucosamine mutase
MPPRFGTDGIRGVANTELTPELATALGRAAARHLPGGSFLVGRDTRRSGPMLQAALCAGIAAEGIDAIDIGVIPTPGLAYLAAERGLPAAMISASHNPFTDNGIKLLSASGTKLADEVEHAIEAELDMVYAAAGRRRPGEGALGGAGVGRIEADPLAVDSYRDHLVGVLAGAGLEGRHVVLDCANGAAEVVGPAVFAAAGAKTSVLNAASDGTNINAGCGSTDPRGLATAVLEAGADVGLAFDGDADRVVAVDETGSVVDGDHLIAMFAHDLQDRGELSGHAVVVTVMSNLGLRQSLAEKGIAIVETPVGDRYVSDALESNGLALGGEQSGHVIFRRHATTGDGILTGLLLMELLVRRDATLSELAAGSMTRLPQVLVSVPVADPARLGAAARIWAEVSRVEEELGSGGRVLLRPSGTESCVRVMVEAPSEEVARRAAEQLAGAVRREMVPAGP